MTAELAPLTQEDAERLSLRISYKLDAMADAWTGAMPLIRQAIDQEAFRVLGYRSHGDYISDRFGGALSKLGVEMRREVTRELSYAGLSTRAIAPVVGVSHAQVASDIKADATVKDLTVDDDPAELRTVVGVNGKTYKVTERQSVTTEFHTDPETGEVIEPEPTGIYSSVWKRPERRAPNRKPLIDDVRKARDEIYNGLSRLQSVVEDDRFTNNKADIQEVLTPVIRLAREVFPDFE